VQKLLPNSQAAVLVFEAVNAQRLLPAKQGRASETAATFCTGTGLTGKTFCNTKVICDATGVFVSDENYLKTHLFTLKIILRNAQQMEKESR
jgi:hypothetical protein